MVDPPASPDPTGDTRSGPNLDSPPSTPRWVYALGIIALVLVVLVVILHLAGGGFGSHMHQP